MNEYTPGACSLERAVSSTQNINDWIKEWKPADLVFTNPDLTIKQLREELEYEKLKQDIPRLMFSIINYLDHSIMDKCNNGYENAYTQAWRIVVDAKNETQSYDWTSTVDKYREYFKHQYKTILK